MTSLCCVALAKRMPLRFTIKNFIKGAAFITENLCCVHGGGSGIVPLECDVQKMHTTIKRPAHGKPNIAENVGDRFEKAREHGR